MDIFDSEESFNGGPSKAVVEFVRKELFAMGVVPPDTITRQIAFCHRDYNRKVDRHTSKVLILTSRKDATAEELIPHKKAAARAHASALEALALLERAVNKQKDKEEGVSSSHTP